MPAKTLYWIRHAQSRHNVTQEAAEKDLLARFPGMHAAMLDTLAPVDPAGHLAVI
jgi:hypothetical protein